MNWNQDSQTWNCDPSNADSTCIPKLDAAPPGNWHRPAYPPKPNGNAPPPHATPYVKAPPLADPIEQAQHSRVSKSAPQAQRKSCTTRQTPSPEPRQPSPRQSLSTEANRYPNRSHSPLQKRGRSSGASTLLKDTAPARPKADRPDCQSGSSHRRPRNASPSTSPSHEKTEATPREHRHEKKTEIVPRPLPELLKRTEAVNGIKFASRSPVCMLDHTLEFTNIVRLGKLVKPSCQHCERDIPVGGNCSVCHICEPLYSVCISCALLVDRSD
jgi:hypothetical protein